MVRKKNISTVASAATAAIAVVLFGLLLPPPSLLLFSAVASAGGAAAVVVADVPGTVPVKYVCTRYFLVPPALYLVPVQYLYSQVPPVPGTCNRGTTLYY